MRALCLMGCQEVNLTPLVDSDPCFVPFFSPLVSILLSLLSLLFPFLKNL